MCEYVNDMHNAHDSHHPSIHFLITFSSVSYNRYRLIHYKSSRMHSYIHALIHTSHTKNTQSPDGCKRYEASRESDPFQCKHRYWTTMFVTYRTSFTISSKFTQIRLLSFASVPYIPFVFICSLSVHHIYVRQNVFDLVWFYSACIDAVVCLLFD